MSFEVLRAAARLMRKRAEAANEGPWVSESNYNGHHDIWSEPDAGSRFELGGDFVPPDGKHIASWHPAVALAVADLLDFEANKDEFLKRHGSRGHDDESWCVKVARAYLGETA